jgi:hypothetical protein
MFEDYGRRTVRLGQKTVQRIRMSNVLTKANPPLYTRYGSATLEFLIEHYPRYTRIDTGDDKS